MEKYLTFEDESSKKFWRVQTDDKEVTVNFGRIGTAGQTQTKEYASAAAAEEAYAARAAALIKEAPEKPAFSEADLAG